MWHKEGAAHVHHSALTVASVRLRCLLYAGPPLLLGHKTDAPQTAMCAIVVHCIRGQGGGLGCCGMRSTLAVRKAVS